jgi:DNA-binding CsgD family transcriptional regulator
VALRRLQATLTAALDQPDIDAWRRVIATECKALVGADKATVILPVNGSYSAFSEEISAKSCGAFPAYVQPLDARFCMWERQVEMGVWRRDAVWGESLDHYLHSAYYHEFIVPERLHDAIGFCCRSGTATAVTADSIAGVWLHHEHENGRKFGSRALRTLEALLPSFSAGVGLLLRLETHRNAFGRLVDGLAVPILIADERGQTLHRTPALERLLADDPESPRLLGAMASMAGELIRVRTGRPLSARTVVGEACQRDIRTARGDHRLRGSTAGPELLGVGPVALVILERIVPQPLGMQALVARFGLSVAQAKVALRLGEGSHYREIAAEQGISVHTVKRHAEQVRVKLRVHSVAEIVAVIARGHLRPH